MVAFCATCVEYFKVNLKCQSQIAQFLNSEKKTLNFSGVGDIFSVIITHLIKNVFSLSLPFSQNELVKMWVVNILFWLVKSDLLLSTGLAS